MIRDRHEVLLSNVEKSRKAREAYLTIGSGSVVPFVISFFAIGAIVAYIRKVFGKSDVVRQSKTMKRMFYVKSEKNIPISEKL